MSLAVFEGDAGHGDASRPQEAQASAEASVEAATVTGKGLVAWGIDGVGGIGEDVASQTLWQVETRMRVVVHTAGCRRSWSSNTGSEAKGPT